MESGFGQQQRLGFNTSDRDGHETGWDLTSADSRETEIAAAPKQQGRRRDARMNPFYGSGIPVVLLANAGCSTAYFDDNNRRN
jgi:hypothetical protein